MTESAHPSEGSASQVSAATERAEWINRVWREVAQDYCSHEGVGKSCVRCRGVVSDVADLFVERSSR